MHKLSGQVSQVGGWVRLRWPLENSSTPATFSPSIVADAFGEVNEDASKLIMKLARLTAKTDFGKPMSPLVIHSNSSRKEGGGTFPQSCSQS